MAANTVASLRVEITGDASGLNRALNQADQGVKDLGNKTKTGFAAIGDGWKMLGGIAAGVGVAAVGIAANFETSMKEISARTGLVGADLEEVRQFALKMGADTSFSAQQASDGFLQLLSSGSSVRESMALMPGVMDLAASGAIDLGYAADALTDIMAQFGVEVVEFEDGSTSADNAIDSLAKAAGASSATVSDLVQGFANVGPVASMFGLTIEETAATLAVLSENGIKSAEAGTALKSVLLNMTRPTSKVKGALKQLGVSLYDVNGDVRDFDTIISDLDTSLDGLPMDEQIRLSTILAGSYGITAFNALRASGGIDEMQSSMDAAAGASEVAEARLGGFAGAWERLQGSLETLAINVATPVMEGILTPAINLTVETIDIWTNDIPEQARILGTHIGKMIGSAIEESVPESMREIGDISGRILSHSLAGIGETITSTLNTEIAGVKPFDLLLKSAVEIVAPGGGEILTMLNDLVTGINDHGLSPTQSVIMRAYIDAQPVWYETLTEDIRSSLAGELAGAAGISPIPWDAPIVVTPEGTDWITDFNTSVRTALEDEAKESLGIPVPATVDPTPGMYDREAFTTRFDLLMKGTLNGALFDVSPALTVMPTLANAETLQASVMGLVQNAVNLMSINVTPNVTVGAAGAGGGGGGNPFGPELPQHATGLANVPFNNYPAMLHKGERVLTANENRNYGSGGGGGVHIHMDGQYYGAPTQEWAEAMKRVLAESGY